MKKQEEQFQLDNYGKRSTFASFLPGISGIRGIPIWCYYVNRGQCVVSFGVDNKDHAIMEFYPAHVAYQNVKTTGFRTFIKKFNKVWEPFSNENVSHQMKIAMNGLEIEEKNPANGLQTNVVYYTLPGEEIGALVRCVTVKNIADETAELELLDGMPALIPYGVSMDSMKNMTQTAKAWMQVENTKERIPYFRVRASMDDTASVQSVEGGNFSACCTSEGKLLAPIVDPGLVFAYDTSLQNPAGFREHTIKELLEQEQMLQNQLPCSFYGLEAELEPGEQVTLYELIGQVQNKNILSAFFAEEKDSSYFEAKKKEAEELVEELTDRIDTQTASKEFDAYCRYTYMDNVLRGGAPIRLGNNKIFYVYSRKHGDLERDYNYFSMLPEFYSQGNGNFRDVNQNRRCDTFFAPFVGRENIHEFYSLIQLDGYNPLGVEKLTYCLAEDKAKKLFHDLPDEKKQELQTFATKPFTPGALYQKLDQLFGDSWNESLFIQIIDFAEGTVNGNFLEGYWSDHWTYNLDLIEDYLEIYPDREKDLLFEEAYTTFLSQINLNHRGRRYEETAGGLRQYHALNEKTRRRPEEGKLVRTAYGKGEVLKMTLLEKLLLLCAVKYATLDAYGMGIEMEGGKPGWYDALNGMPGLFGSSMAETYELARMMSFTLDELERYPGEVRIINELGEFIEKLAGITESEYENLMKEEQVLTFWNRINDVKETYRDQTYAGISGEKRSYSTQELGRIFGIFREVVDRGIQKACELSGGICPTYFTYEVPEYEVAADGSIRPRKFVVQTVPHFLEGPVRYLKLPGDKAQKTELYRNVKNSDLYDEKLQMYKVNASLQEASYELGRARAFTPGWLENESIWLHMEYKYLLELLRSGLYEEFFADFHHAAVPFLNPDVYGRSIYENSSFIASSKNPNPAYRGKGFVARLSGSTIEFISMWKRMMFGAEPFIVKNGALAFAPQPILPAYLIPEEKEVSAMLLGKTKVTYVFETVRDYTPDNAKVSHMEFLYENGSKASVDKEYTSAVLAEDIRAGRIHTVKIWMTDK